MVLLNDVEASLSENYSLRLNPYFLRKERFSWDALHISLSDQFFIAKTRIEFPLCSYKTNAYWFSVIDVKGNLQNKSEYIVSL